MVTIFGYQSFWLVNKIPSFSSLINNTDNTVNYRAAKFTSYYIAIMLETL